MCPPPQGGLTGCFCVPRPGLLRHHPTFLRVPQPGAAALDVPPASDHLLQVRQSPDSGKSSCYRGDFNLALTALLHDCTVMKLLRCCCPGGRSPLARSSKTNQGLFCCCLFFFLPIATLGLLRWPASPLCRGSAPRCAAGARPFVTALSNGRQHTRGWFFRFSLVGGAGGVLDLSRTASARRVKFPPSRSADISRRPIIQHCLFSRVIFKPPARRWRN